MEATGGARPLVEEGKKVEEQDKVGQLVEATTSSVDVVDSPRKSGRAKARQRVKKRS